MLTLRRVAQGYATLLVGIVAGKVLALVSEVALGRSLGPERLGVYGAGITALGYGLCVANFGLDLVGMRTVSEAPDRAADFAREIRRNRLGIAAVLCVLGIACAWMNLIPVDLAFPLCLATIALAFRDDWLLMALGHERQVATASVLRDASFLLLVFLIVPRTKSAASAAWCFLAAEFAWSAYIQWAVRQGAAAPPFLGPSVRRVNLLAQGWPIALMGLLMLTVGRVGTAVVTWLRGPAEGGTYYAAYRVLIACLAITLPIGRVALPQLARQGAMGGDPLGRKTLRLALLTSLAGCCLALFIFHCPDLVLRALYGAAYIQGAPVLRILSISLFLSISYSIGLQQLLAVQRQGRLLAIAGTAAAVNLAVGIGLTPNLGATGGAYGAAAADLTFAFGVLYCLRGELNARKYAGALAWLTGASVVGSLAAIKAATGEAPRLFIAVGVVAVLCAPMLAKVLGRDRVPEANLSGPREGDIVLKPTEVSSRKLVSRES